MSIVIVQYRIRDGAALAVDEINANFYAISEELDGRLNEHNFEVNGFAQTDVDETAVYTWHYTKTTVTPFFDWPGGPAPPFHTAATSYNALVSVITQQGGWVLVDGMTKTNTSTQGGDLWVVASFQHDHQDDYLTAHDAASIPYRACNGVLYGIRVNGQLVEESVLGSLDWSNDLIRHAISGGGTEATNSVRASGGIMWPALPLVCDALIRIPPGPYTVELVAYVFPGQERKRVFVSNRELIVLRMEK